ncbi:MAG: hypothetical protein IMF19_12415 [Proteobacteria bacterium]|nr:hypothetical protein [Pseudomonadota bacterium]
MMYPGVYDAQEVEQVKMGPILYPNEIGKGADEEDCVICFGDDIIADNYISLSEGDIVELSEAEVDKYTATRWEGRNEPEEKVIDPDKILAILAKKMLNKPQTDEDKDAIDPDKRTPGINRMNKDHNLFFHRFTIDNV